MAITKILNIKESEGRNPASHLKNALEYIQNLDKTEECVLVGGINCLPDTAFEQMKETKNIFHKQNLRLYVVLFNQSFQHFSEIRFCYFQLTATDQPLNSWIS